MSLLRRRHRRSGCTPAQLGNNDRRPPGRRRGTLDGQGNAVCRRRPAPPRGCVEHVVRLHNIATLICRAAELNDGIGDAGSDIELTRRARSAPSLGIWRPRCQMQPMPHPESWLKVLPQGLYCEPGGFFVDPLTPVDRAVVTHAHSDHARRGHRAVLGSADTLALMRARLGADDARETEQALAWGEAVTIGDVRVWLQPAGHVLGSAQVAMEYFGTRAVVSGDYKRVADPTCAPFEPIACDVFITEATFALPVFVHPPPEHEIVRLLDSVALFPERTHVVGCYALGKCRD